MLSGQGVDPASLLRRGEEQTMAMKCNFNTLPLKVVTNYQLSVVKYKKEETN